MNHKCKRNAKIKIYNKPQKEKRKMNIFYKNTTPHQQRRHQNKNTTPNYRRPTTQRAKSVHAHYEELELDCLESVVGGDATQGGVVGLGVGHPSRGTPPEERSWGGFIPETSPLFRNMSLETYFAFFPPIKYIQIASGDAAQHKADSITWTTTYYWDGRTREWRGWA